MTARRHPGPHRWPAHLSPCRRLVGTEPASLLGERLDRNQIDVRPSGG